MNTVYQMPNSHFQSDSPAMPVNELAAAYQPRRIWAAAVSIGWNLALAVFFLAGRGETRLYFRLERLVDRLHLPPFVMLGPIYIGILFFACSIANYPVELWFGYLEERQFGLAKDGIRAWTRDWMRGVGQHAILFCTGGTLLLILQISLPHSWLLVFSLSLLAIFTLTSYFALALLPDALFQIEPIDAVDQIRIDQLLKKSRYTRALPPLLIFSAPNQRDFCGGLMGFGGGEVLLLSRSTIHAASDSLLRFVLLHDLGHRRFHHIFLSTLAGWAWVALGLVASDHFIGHYAPSTVGHAPYLAWMALTLSIWMAVGEPVLAYLGRRLEYQADRYYLRQGGGLTEMRVALEELSRRNHARTEDLRRRHTMFHPLPSVWNRLHAAQRFMRNRAHGIDRSL